MISNNGSVYGPKVARYTPVMQIRPLHYSVMPDFTCPGRWHMQQTLQSALYRQPAEKSRTSPRIQQEFSSAATSLNQVAALFKSKHFQPEDINIDIDNNYLTISAERKYENTEKDKKGSVIRSERSYGSFSRSFDISGVVTDKIEAEYENGVLKLTLPKKEETVPKARRLEIK